MVLGLQFQSEMKKTIPKAIVALSLMLGLSGITARAYDLDTHFYGTYSMARFAGIKHEVALKIATGAQWMDESYISDPTSMILMPTVGVKKRRLLHFPGSRVANKLTIDRLPSILDPSSGMPLKSFTETEADHEFATEMLTEGLMEGNFLKASVGIHTLEDSFAHAGTIAELGHAHFWHHPDRPYADQASIDKYFKMTRSVLRAMVAIRSLLPASGVDSDVRFSDSGPNSSLNGDQLADIYEKLPEVRHTITKNILNEPSFVRFALANVFQRAKQVDYVRAGYQGYLEKFNPGEDAYEAVGTIVKSMPIDLINVPQILKDTGRPDATDDYITSMGGKEELLAKVVRDLLSGIVPRLLDVYHRFEKEEDGPVWNKELDLRVANMRAMIFTLYQKDIFFVHNQTKTKEGYLKELARDHAANPVLPLPNGKTKYVTYSLQEKYKFDQMIFSFLFPKTTQYLQNDLDEIIKLAAIAENPVQQGTMINVKADDILMAGANILKGFTFFSKSAEAFKLSQDDVATAHLIPHANNRFYAYPKLLQKEIATGIFKPLLTDQQIKQMALEAL
jgi:hypothetical protein